MESLVLYGGGFDPIHNGHIRLAREAGIAFKADVLLIPNRVPPWKTPFATVEERLDMIRLAIKESKLGYLKLSTYEIDSDQEVNYSIDTIKHFVQTYPKKKLYLLIGADEANAFDKWKCPDEIASLVQIVVIPRPGLLIRNEMMERFHMIRLDYKESGDVSSSAVRALRHNDIPVKVRDYIEDHELYYMKMLKERYSSKRLNHCIEVGRLAYAIALKNGVERPWRLYVAGLLHDIAKSQSKPLARLLMKKEFPAYVDMPEWTYHQFIGSLLAEREYRIQDKEIIDAIACHASGKGEMTIVDKILYASDKIEPTRGYDSSSFIKECLANAEEGFKTVLKANWLFYQEQGWSFVDNPFTQACVEHYLGE